MIGPSINAGAILFGGILDALFSQHLPERIRASMTPIFGLCFLGIGILLVTKCANLLVMVLATLVDALVGEFCYLEKGANTTVARARQFFVRSDAGTAHESFIQSYVATIVLLCVSGTEIFGTIHEGMTGDPSILIAKSFFDFFTATTFACLLGIAVPAICVSVLTTQLTLTTCAVLILPLMTPAMVADFSAAGGPLLLIAGLRICGIKMFAAVDMLPALLLAILLSAAWTAFFT